MTECPQNLKPARGAHRTNNSHHYAQSAVDRGEGTRTTISTRAYRGSHLAARMHRADAAQHRSSRMGRHHQDHQQNRW